MCVVLLGSCIGMDFEMVVWMLCVPHGWSVEVVVSRMGAVLR